MKCNVITCKYRKKIGFLQSITHVKYTLEKNVLPFGKKEMYKQYFCEKIFINLEDISEGDAVYIHQQCGMFQNMV